MPRNPFGDEPPPQPRAPNPFGEDAEDGPDADPADTIEHASARIRRLRSLVGSEGLTLSGTRELLDQVTKALDAVARALRER
jgi:hypothetical protein